MNAVWRKVWLEVVRDFRVFDPIPRQEDLQQEIAELANSACLSAEGEDAINADDIAELVQSHADDLSAEDLVEQQRELAAREEVEQESPVPKAMTLADLRAVVQSGLDFIDIVLVRDGNADRSFKVRTAVQALLCPYEESLQQKRARGKQTNITKFFTSSAATSLTLARTGCQACQECFPITYLTSLT
ncbi:hypothetical protein E2C01_059491 [Portunus trituberculatus]|uniref:Uncharacterized protein n=1 Tax=Portunus trituberculatus TaxID=210409 RepID=A0A5B7H7W4_PORTR|nr:hypothetical protein [Portunus trituberculatus]